MNHLAELCPSGRLRPCNDRGPTGTEWPIRRTKKHGRANRPLASRDNADLRDAARRFVEPSGMVGEIGIGSAPIR